MNIYKLLPNKRINVPSGVTYQINEGDILFSDPAQVPANQELEYFQIDYAIKSLYNENGSLNTVSFDTIYNTFLQEYEELTKTLNKEYELPNAYSFVAGNHDARDLKTYLDSLDINNLFKELVSGKYFDDITDLFKQEVFLFKIAALFSDDKYKKIFIVNKVLNELKNLYNSFPMSNLIKINTIDANIQIANQLRELDVLDMIIHYIINNAESSGFPAELEYIRTNIAGIPQNTFEKTGKTITINKLNLPNNIGLLINKLLSTTNKQEHATFSDRLEKQDWNLPKIMKFKKILEQSSDSSITDIFGTTQNDADVLCFEIVKYEKNQTGLTWLQTFYVPVQSEIQYYDTQIIEDKTYVYQIYAHVLGTNNKYKINKTANPTLYKINHFEQEYALFRIPWYNTTEQIEKGQYEKLTPKNSPPLIPDIEIVLFERTNNKCLINLRNNQGSTIDTPLFFSDEERKLYLNKYNVKYNTTFDFWFKINGKVEYKSDDLGGIIEVYRLVHPPESYDDFWPISKTRRFINFIAGTQHFVDDIEPNTKYYYCARVKDIHGNYSNPSPIFEVEIINFDDSLPFFSSKLYEFKKQKRKLEKSFKKYILIKPSELQSEILNLQSIQDGSEKQPQLGQIWGKKFILEITSKKTGKKIDLVLNCPAPKQIDKTLE